jgi:predicted AAA+ superfamily ATPase
MYELNTHTDPESMEGIIATKSQYVADVYPLLNVFLKNYIYKLYLKSIEDAIIKVNRFYGMTSFQSAFLTEPKTSYDKDTGLYSFDDDYLFVSAVYENHVYEITFKSIVVKEYGLNKSIQFNNIWISGATPGADKSKELSAILSDEAIKHSNLSGKVMKYTSPKVKSGDLLTNIKIINTPSVKLDDLYIPESKKEQIKRYIYAINNFHKNYLSLRYLFNGKPGTGKTQLLSTIINETLGNITVLVCNGEKLPVSDIFSFCEYFSPCLLIIDDLDFLAGDRSDSLNKAELGNFLQALDGFLPNNVFLLAATNDKKLVDEAASRPGRFDLILDIGEINPEDYLSLINRETKDANILSFFDDIILNDLRCKKVSGAFLVSFIKQLSSAQMMRGTLTSKDFKDYLELTHNGFYSYNAESYEKTIGFLN